MPDYNSKVIFGNETLIDLTEDSVSPQTLLNGETAHDRSGAPITGTATQGHVIKDDTTTFTQRGGLKFENATVTDDATNDQTIVNVGADPTTYSTNDSVSATINDTDYVPMSESGGTKKKTLWTTIVDKIKTALGIASSGSTYLKKDGTWGTPTNTTYTFATGDANGQIKVTPSGGTAQNVDVKGLGSAAYETADATATASTVVKRNGSGYIYGVYFNATNTTAQNIASYTSTVVFQSSDGFFRKTSKANLQSWLGLGSNAYTSTAYLPLAGGTITGNMNVDADGGLYVRGESHTSTGSVRLQIGSPSQNNYGVLRVYGGTNAAYYSDLKTATLTANRTLTIPNSTGTIALTSQVLLNTGGDVTGKISSSAQIQAVGAIASGCGSMEVAGTTYTNQAGALRVFDSAAHYASIVASSMTANRTITLPSTTSTLATTTQVDAKVSLSGDTMTSTLTINRNNGTTSEAGLSYIVLGNSTASGTAKNSCGIVRIYSLGTSYIQLRSQTTSDTRTLYLPTSGTALATSASSSARVKENIRDMTDEEARKILDIDVVKFDYKEEYEPNLLDQSGVIAEEVIDIIPEVVTVHPMYDETKAIDPASNPSPTVDYAKFTPYLIKMIQMQQQKIEELEQRLAALEN